MKDIDLPTIIVKEADDIKPPIPGDFGEFLEGIMNGARSCFEEDKEVRGLFFECKDHKITTTGFDGFDDETKSKIFQWMQSRVPLNDACIFVNEVWFVRALPSEFKDGAGLLIMPRDRVDRREMVMVNLWTPTRRITLVAEITRKPDTLGEWELFEDTANPKEGVRAEGPMIGVPFRKEKKP